MVIEITTAVAITIAIVEVIKRAIQLNTQYAPLVSLLVGLILATIFFGTEDLRQTIFNGLIIGLSAGGTFDVIKKTLYEGTYKKLNISKIK